MNDIINKLLHIIKTDIHVYNNLIEKKYDERETIDTDVLVYQDDEYVDADAYHIDLKIEYLKGSIGASKHIMQLIKDNIDNL